MQEVDGSIPSGSTITSTFSGPTVWSYSWSQAGKLDSFCRFQPGLPSISAAVAVVKVKGSDICAGVASGEIRSRRRCAGSRYPASGAATALAVTWGAPRRHPRSVG